MKKSGATTTISGGICLGPKDGADNVGKTKDNVGKIKDKGKTGKGESRERADSSGQGKGLNRRSSVQANRRPNPIVIARPSSQNSNRISKHAEDAPLSSSAPRNITAPVSAPRTAMEAAVDAATQKHNAMSGGDALSSLQKMISDLKAISPSSAVSAPSSWGSASGSRSASANKEAPAQVTPATGGITSPVPIPRAGKKLKADAPSFTPSFQPSSSSPAATQPSVSPGTANAPPWPAQPRSASHGSVRRASSSSNGQGSLPSFITMPDTAASCGSGYVNPNSHLSLATVNAYQSHLHVHPEAENEDLSPMYSQHVDAQYQHNQVLAAQQLQYQQIQLLQAQLATAQLSQQQQQQQQQQMGNFMAPRFQALAAQRAAQQQQQQLQQLAHAQQLYELQQQQLLEAQRHQEESARAAAQTVLSNPPAVFEDDSPETKTVSLGPTGRPQLAPSFTFGAKPRSESDRDSMSPPQQAPVINRSEGIGGAAATGLAGLAARAHRRTGSEMSPAMQQQVGDVPQAVLTSQLELQKEIEALQAKQKALMQEDLATSSSGLNQLNARAKQTPSQTIARHRRVQSSLPSATPADPFTGVTTADSPEPRQVIRGFGEMPPPPVPAGHSRRHSVNVLNKPAGTGRGFGMSQDIPEDGLPDGGGHHRSGSRSSMDMGSWRVQNSGAISDLAAAQAQLQSLAQFRAAAGGGHSKMASFSFPNMLPNLLAATTLSTPVGQSLWQQQHAFQMQLQQTSQGPQRKSLFAPYLPQASLPPLLNAGKLVVGVLRVNKKNRSDAYVATDVLEADIYICGSKDRNRALEGDIVAVELLDVDEVWNTKKDKEEKKRKKEETAAYDFKPAQVKKLEKKKDDVEVEGQGLTLFEDEEVNDETKPTYAGHVVAVVSGILPFGPSLPCQVERMPGQLFSGQIGVLRPSSAATKEKQEFERREREGDKAKKDEPEARPKIVWFKPTDKRVPLIAIPTEQAPTDFIDDPDAYIDRLFVATIKRWPM